MLYTGDEQHTEEMLSMADIYWNGDNSVLDLKVKVLYGDDQNSIISQYVKFTKVYKDQVKKLGRSKEAVLETIRTCKEQDVLKEYLEEHEAEVIDIMMTLYDRDTIMEMHDSSLKREAVFAKLVSLVKKGLLTVDVAAEEANMTPQEFMAEAEQLQIT